MATLKKIHLVKNNSHVDAWKLNGKYVPTFNFIKKEETYCGKIMSFKFITSNPSKTTCQECLNNKFKNNSK